jgi:hypothetical protein
MLTSLLNDYVGIEEGKHETKKGKYIKIILKENEKIDDKK